MRARQKTRERENLREIRLKSKSLTNDNGYDVATAA